MQERFLEKFRALEQWEQLLLLSTVQRIANMMDAEDIDMAPILASGPVTGLKGSLRQAGGQLERHESKSIQEASTPPTDPHSPNDLEKDT